MHASMPLSAHQLHLGRDLTSTPLQENVLAHSALLGRGSEQHDRAVDAMFLHCGPEAERRRKAGNGNEVVTTRMSHTWQSVVLRVKRERPSAATVRVGRPEGGGQLLVSSLDVKALCLQEVGQVLVCTLLMVSQLGVLPNPQ